MQDRDRGPDASSSDEIANVAAEWFARLLDDSATPNDRAAFRTWLEASPEHAVAYAQLERLWLGAAMVPDRYATGPLSRRKLLKAGGAAAIVVSTGLSAAAYLRPVPADYRTAVGETAIVTLPDGSTVELSTASAISLNFTSTERGIMLLEGEAYFTVAPDASRRFVVHADTLKTAALGTQFSVAIREDAITVAVAEHAVRVSSPFQSQDVQEGQSVVFANDRISSPADTDVGSRLSWRDGKLVFISTPLEDAVSTLARWRRGKIIVMDTALAKRPISLIIDVRRAGNILQTLEHGLPIKVDTYSPWLALIYPR